MSWSTVKPGHGDLAVGELRAQQHVLLRDCGPDEGARPDDLHVALGRLLRARTTPSRRRGGREASALVLGDVARRWSRCVVARIVSISSWFVSVRDLVRDEIEVVGRLELLVAHHVPQRLPDQLAQQRRRRCGRGARGRRRARSRRARPSRSRGRCGSGRPCRARPCRSPRARRCSAPSMLAPSASIDGAAVLVAHERDIEAVRAQRRVGVRRGLRRAPSR